MRVDHEASSPASVLIFSVALAYWRTSFRILSMRDPDA
jgi:hypothetical protein